MGANRGGSAEPICSRRKHRYARPLRYIPTSRITTRRRAPGVATRGQNAETVGASIAPPLDEWQARAPAEKKCWADRRARGRRSDAREEVLGALRASRPRGRAAQIGTPVGAARRQEEHCSMPEAQTSRHHLASGDCAGRQPPPRCRPVEHGHIPNLDRSLALVEDFKRRC